MYKYLLLVLGLLIGVLLTINQSSAQQFSREDDLNEGGLSWAGLWGDYNNDGNLDLFVANANNSYNFLYQNSLNGTLTRITEGYIATDVLSSSGGSWGDYNNDGYLDLFVTNLNSQYNMLYRNDGPDAYTFTRIYSFSPSYGGNSYSCSWVDYNNDNYLDIFVANGGSTNLDNFLYLNHNGLSFEQITTGDIVNDGGNSWGCSWADYDNDGDLDLFVANYSQNNFLYQNNNDGTFSKITTGDIVNDGGNSTGASWADIDNDHYLDLFVTNYGQDNFLYRNNGDGTFSKDTSDTLATDRGNSYGSSWGDIDNDGDLDLLVTNFGQNNFLYTNDGSGTFSRQTDAIIFGDIVSDIGNSIGATFCDYNNDGTLDVFIANYNQDNFFYRNNDYSNHWLNIKCVSASSNLSAIGAKVRVEASVSGNPLNQLREISSQTGLGGQNSLNAEFGLGNPTTITSIEVEWPSGVIQTIAGPYSIDAAMTVADAGILDPNEPNDTVELATLILIDNSKEGQIETNADVDWFTFSNNSAQTLRMYTEQTGSSSLNPELLLYGPNNSDLLIGRDDDSHGSSQPELTSTLPNIGTYWIKIKTSPSASGSEETGDYRLSLEQVSSGTNPLTYSFRPVTGNIPASGSTLIDVLVKSNMDTITIYQIDAYLQYDPAVFGVPTITDNMDDGSYGWFFSNIDPAYDTNGERYTIQYSKGTNDGPGLILQPHEEKIIYTLRFPIVTTIAGTTTMLEFGPDPFCSAVDTNQASIGITSYLGTYIVQEPATCHLSNVYLQGYYPGRLDTIKIELRTDPAVPQPILSYNYIPNGTGTDTLYFFGVTNLDPYYIIATHFNHLAVRTANPFPFSLGSTTSIDLSNTSYTPSGERAALYTNPGDDQLLMRGGDANADGAVSVLDFAIFVLNNGTTAQEPSWDRRADFNGDEVVSILDFVVFALNNGNYTYVSNFNRALPPSSLTRDENQITFRLKASTNKISPTEKLTVDIQIVGEASIAGLDAYLHYDPTVFGKPEIMDFLVGSGYQWQLEQVESQKGIVKYSKGNYEKIGCKLNGETNIYRLTFPVLEKAPLDKETYIEFGPSPFYAVIDDGYQALAVRTESLPITIINKSGEKKVEVPSKYSLYPNYPNPFNPETQISFDLPTKSHVSIHIYDVSGRLVRTLINDEKRAGCHSVAWNGTDESERLLSSGIYFYHLEAENYQAIKQMVLLK